MKRNRTSAFLCLALFLDQGASAAESATAAAAQTASFPSNELTACADDPIYVTKLGL
eukprot:CAMPEP_0178715956 /NCGR_PEP_ID=MMETSP0699-20121125/20990_1 /TAXON_ID=265572 /ORGANISM="Extubocellulus spinifer, Strain CCMP396" /LENGTH=56 /DNA_ID=CAMNT_0020365405 /DNA_START=40 /DNA_END=207 /DNA_ORIENTATION=+